MSGERLPVVGVVGLGYVGLPLAQAFARDLPVIGFDINRERVNELKRRNKNDNFTITDVPVQISEADFIIIAVPTPVTRSKEPDLSYVVEAAKIVRRHMKKGATVILESTVYPGVTEEVVKPILEESGMVCGIDFKIGYSPERINPGDTAHTIDQVTKVVSGMDQETLEKVASLYGRVCAKVFRARDIRTAEAAKVIENIQRDLNIALFNELSIIFERLGLNSRDIFEAASTKWNFNRYAPGMVGGHCIPVDPYYLVYKAKIMGYQPQVILAGRIINDFMPHHVSHLMIKALNASGKVINGSRVLLMGLTYKENVPDTRETPAHGIIEELREYGVHVLGYDPLLTNIREQFGIEPVDHMAELRDIDGIILCVMHEPFKNLTLKALKTVTRDSTRPILVDVRGVYNETEVVANGFFYKTL
jgi:UDP-N-acetyl-D-galactosamine dehydrogenase